MTREQCWNDAVESANVLMRTRGRAEWSATEYDHAKMIFRRRWGKVGHEVDVERRYMALTTVQEEAGHVQL